MPGPRSRFDVSRPPGRFLDRVAEFAVVRQHLALLRSDPGHLRVFEISGLGGIGKTRFLGELREQLAEDERGSRLVWVPLEAEASASATGPLTVLRDQMSFPCLLFDAALLTYAAATGQPVAPRAERSRPRNLALQAVQTGGTVAGVPLPLTFAVDLYDSVDRLVVRRRRYARSEFAEIDALRSRPAELYDRLPHFLGLDIARRVVADGARLVVFYDSYDKQSRETLRSGAPWLRELIASIGSGVHLITSRDRLRWHEDGWSDVVEPLVLDTLPEEDCRSMVRDALGSVSPALEDHLLRATHRVPFFLQAIIDVCHRRAAEGQPVDPAHLPSDPDGTVEHLLRHLDAEQRTLAVAASALQHFDEPLFVHLVRALNLAVNVNAFDEFVGWFFVTDLGDGMFQVHDLLTESVRVAEQHAGAVGRAVRAAADHLALRATTPDDRTEATVQLFHSTMQAAGATGTPPQTAEVLVDVGYALYDAGLWGPLGQLSAPAGAPAGGADAVATFLSALVTRRTTGPGAALARLAPLEGHKELLGRHSSSFDIEVAYLSEIMGSYARARQEFAQLYEAAQPFDPTRRDHIRAWLYHADILTMDGRFADAGRILAEAAEVIGASRPLDWTELVRHRAHVYRFSLLPDQAERLYLRSLQHVTHWPSMRGKLLTNLAETRCWLEPAAALDDADAAVRLNRQLGNRLEVGKAEAARSIALAAIGRPEESRAACDRAVDEFEAVTYPAGIALAHQARATCEARTGQQDRAVESFARLRRAVEELGTYEHLLVVPAALLGEEAERARIGRTVQWMQPQDVDVRLDQITRSST